MSRKRLVPRLCLGTHRPRGSASQALLTLPVSAETRRQSLLGTAFPGRAWERGRSLVVLIVVATAAVAVQSVAADDQPVVYPPRYCENGFERAGYPQEIACRARPSDSPTYCGYTVGGGAPIAVSRAISTKEPGAGTTPAGSSNAASASTGSTACDIKAARAPTKPTARGYSMCISSVLASYNVTVDEPNG